jgi:hypothetical protein
MRKLKDLNDNCTLRQNISLIKEMNFSFWYFVYGNQIESFTFNIADELYYIYDDIYKTNGWYFHDIQLPLGEYEVRNIINFEM